MVICDERPAASRAQVLEKIQGVDAAYWATKIRLDKEMLDAAGSYLHISLVFDLELQHVSRPPIKIRC